MILPFFFPRYVDSAIRGSGRGEEPSGGNVLRLIQIRLAMSRFEKIWLACQDNSPRARIVRTVRQLNARMRT